MKKIFLPGPKTNSQEEAVLASYPVAFSILKKVPVSIENFGEEMNLESELFFAKIQKLGVQIHHQNGKILVTPQERIFAPGKVHFQKMPLSYPVIMTLAAFADGISEFHGFRKLDAEDQKRVKILNQGLLQIGVSLVHKGDKVTIHGDSDFCHHFSKNELIETGNDPLVTMTFGVLKLVLEAQYELSHPDAIQSLWPRFWLSLAEWNENLRSVSGLILKKETDGQPPQFLIVKKPRKDHAWQFPQGGVDNDESDRAASERELREECGDSLKIRFIKKNPVGVYRYFFPPHFRRHDPSILGARVRFFYAEYVEGEVIVDEKEIMAYKWVDAEALKDYFDKKYLVKMEKILGRL